MEKYKVYISGPASRCKYYGDDRRRAFFDAEAILLEKGYIPVNPLLNGLPDNALENGFARVGLAMLLECDYIYMLNDWQMSEIARLELCVAQVTGISILFENEMAWHAHIGTE